MKQLLILSGKGGTGKTTIASAFIKLASAKTYADCDVDAPNLHLIMQQGCEPMRRDYFGMSKAEIDANLCIACGLCKENCRFQAISSEEGFRVNSFYCEGCGVCEAICPSGAVSLKPAVAGALMLYNDSNRTFSTAQLKMGSGTTGMLVTEVKKQMKAAASPDTTLAVIDGSPGIGCPVIASLSGVDMVLIVAEPSISGINDMERIIKTAKLFKVKVSVCINKYNTNLVNTEKIEKFCETNDLPYTGRIPFDPAAVSVVNQGLTIVDIDCPSGSAAKVVFDHTMKLLFKESDNPIA
ncbi:MAG TPA: ATP-binding protein [Bacillota bacterium]|nr:ATP-binding protein [Bacillota bacterium]